MTNKKKASRRAPAVEALDEGLIKYTDMVVSAALSEDVGPGDITTLLTVPSRKKGFAKIVARERLVVSGQFVARAAFKQLNSKVVYRELVPDGGIAKKGEVVATISGNLRAMLTAERVALNFLQRLSGIATLTSAFVKKARGVELLDTRKTTPCLRLLERYSVAAGGGVNHRFGLYDAVLIKENHIVAAGGVTKAVEKVKLGFLAGSAAVLPEGFPSPPGGFIIEVEASSLKEVREAAALGVDIILLDNMQPATLRKAVRIVGGRALTEASGGVTIESIGEVAATGVDRISTGTLTHSARAVDLSLLVDT